MIISPSGKKHLREPSSLNQIGSANREWCPPPKGMLKLNTDASFNQGRSIAHAGIIIRNEEGDILTGLIKTFHATFPLLVEALALREGIMLAHSLGIQKLMAESDCLEVIRSCRGEIKRGEILSLVKDVLGFKDKFQFLGFTWVSKVGNMVAHNIASLASNQSLPLSWTWN